MAKLTIYEIIDHCKRKTKRYEQLNGIKTLENADVSNNFVKEYWEHRQVAEYLEKLQQYRAIGTVEEIKEILQIISEGQEDVDENGISTGLLHTLLEYAEYAKIGTVEECREARERQMAKKPLIKLKNKTKSKREIMFILNALVAEKIFFLVFIICLGMILKNHTNIAKIADKLLIFRRHK